MPLCALVAVAGTRWKVEEGFAGGKELAALDRHQVRAWTSWMRWTILAMLAHAFLSVMTADQPGPDAGDVHRDETGHELIPLTATRSADSSPACSTARNCHYQRRQALAVT